MTGFTGVASVMQVLLPASVIFALVAGPAAVVVAAGPGEAPSVPDRPHEEGSAPGGSGESGGLVLGFGKVLQPPFVFSGVGDSVLFLNGLQVFPQPFARARQSPEPTGEEPPVELLRTERDRVEREFEALRSDLAGRPELDSLVLALFRESPAVEVAEIDGPHGAVLVQWRDGPPLIYRFGDAESGRPPPDRPRLATNARAVGIRQSLLIEQFHRTVAAGGLFAFGDDYLITGPASAADRMRSWLANGPRGAGGDSVPGDLAPAIVRDVREAADP